jgi:SOS-response transcriptional repressor LexA
MSRKTIPLVPLDASSSCEDAAPFALMVLGAAMAPQFADGDIIVVEPEGAAADGSFVVAWHEGEWLFRQLVGGAGAWRLHALDPAVADIAIGDLSCVRGVVVQQRSGRRRRAIRYYVGAP